MEITKNAVALHGADHGAHLRFGIETGADFGRPERGDSFFGQRVENFLVNDPARGGAANLPGVEGDGPGPLRGRRGDVGVVEHDRRALAAEFQFAGYEAASARFADPASDFR